MAALKYLVLHCTATPAGREVTSGQLREWHTAAPPRGNGWRQVGYTDMIHLDGTVERLVANNEDANVDPWEITNGVAGKNSVSRHVVYVGGCDRNMKPADTRTPQQLRAMENYIKDFHHRFPEVKIIGHRDLAAKACPSFDVAQWLQTIGIKQ